MIWGSNPSRCKWLVCSQKLPDSLQGLPSPLFNASRETFPGSRMTGAEFYPLPKLRTSGCISPFPLYVFMPCIRTTLPVSQTLNLYHTSLLRLHHQCHSFNLKTISQPNYFVSEAISVGPSKFVIMCLKTQVYELLLFISVINHLDAQNFCFTISLFYASTCFEFMCSSSGGQNYITQPLVSSNLQVAVSCTG